MSKMILSFQGEKGAYSHLAANKIYTEGDVLPCATFEDAIAAVQEKRADYAILPIENSQWGRVADIHHLLPESDLFIIGEHFHRIRHHLLAHKDATLEDIQTVYSHPQALGQCRNRLRELGIQPVAFDDTAGAARWIADRGDKREAAIASSLAGEIYGLKSLLDNLEDADHNTTRFLVMARDPVHPPEGTHCITSLVFRIKNLPACLYKTLGGFATNGVNLTKIESYQLGGQFTATQFYLEIEGHPRQKAVQQALDELSFYSRHLKILGTYLAHTHRFA